MAHNGSSTLNKVLLAQTSMPGMSFTDDTIEDVYVATNYVTVRRHGDFIHPEFKNPNVSYLQVGNEIFGARKVNTIANEMIATIKDLEFLGNVAEETLAKVIKFRTDILDTLSDDEKAFLMPEVAPNHAILIQYSQGGASIPLATFQNIFGPVLGTSIFNVYSSGADRMKEVIKIFASLNTAPSDATELEKKLIEEYSTEKLTKFLEGKFDGVSDYYKAKLSTLPGHIRK